MRRYAGNPPSHADSLLPPRFIWEAKMMIMGYCQSCHRMRRVYVRVYLGKGIPVGTCADCQRKG